MWGSFDIISLLQQTRKKPTHMNYKLEQDRMELKHLDHDIITSYFDDFYTNFEHYGHCRKCSSPNLSRHQFHLRHIYFSFDCKIRINVRRYRCRSCKKTETILPPLLTKFRRYTTSFLFKIIQSLFKKGLTVYRAAEKYNLSSSYIFTLKKIFIAKHDLKFKTISRKLQDCTQSDLFEQYRLEFGMDYMQTRTTIRKP